MTITLRTKHWRFFVGNYTECVKYNHYKKIHSAKKEILNTRSLNCPVKVEIFDYVFFFFWKISVAEKFFATVSCDGFERYQSCTNMFPFAKWKSYLEAIQKDIYGSNAKRNEIKIRSFCIIALAAEDFEAEVQSKDIRPCGFSPPSVFSSTTQL